MKKDAVLAFAKEELRMHETLYNDFCIRLHNLVNESTTSNCYETNMITLLSEMIKVKQQIQSDRKAIERLEMM